MGRRIGNLLAIASLSPSQGYYRDSDDDLESSSDSDDSDSDGRSRNPQRRSPTEPEQEEDSLESRFVELPPRKHLPSAAARAADRRPINPILSRLTANLVVKYEHLAQFQAFMERYHCFPYVTEYKFPINMWINEHLEGRNSRQKRQQQQQERLEQAQKDSSCDVVEPSPQTSAADIDSDASQKKDALEEPQQTPNSTLDSNLPPFATDVEMEQEQEQLAAPQALATDAGCGGGSAASVGAGAGGTCLQQGPAPSGFCCTDPSKHDDVDVDADVDLTDASSLPPPQHREADTAAARAAAPPAAVVVVIDAAQDLGGSLYSPDAPSDAPSLEEEGDGMDSSSSSTSASSDDEDVGGDADEVGHDVLPAFVDDEDDEDGTGTVAATAAAALHQYMVPKSIVVERCGAPDGGAPPDAAYLHATRARLLCGPGEAHVDERDWHARQRRQQRRAQAPASGEADPGLAVVSQALAARTRDMLASPPAALASILRAPSAEENTGAGDVGSAAWQRRVLARIAPLRGPTYESDGEPDADEDAGYTNSFDDDEDDGSGDDSDDDERAVFLGRAKKRGGTIGTTPPKSPLKRTFAVDFECEYGYEHNGEYDGEYDARAVRSGDTLPGSPASSSSSSSSSGDDGRAKTVTISRAIRQFVGKFKAASVGQAAGSPPGMLVRGPATAAAFAAISEEA